MDEDNKAVEQMTQMYDNLYQMMGTWLSQDNEPLAVAAVLLATALRVYRTSLTDEDYDQMMDYLSDTRENIEPFPTPEEIIGTLN
ncbi:MAG: hypothetical protein EBU08_21415 [Micrococcales bacterium]|nr:hypothetical protein [Micrococcales bacterium]